MVEVAPGLYRHFKGKMYRVLGTARHSETLEEMVMYQVLYHSKDFGPHVFFVRPVAMFTEMVNRDGYEGPRFQFISADGPFVCKDCGASV